MIAIYNADIATMDENHPFAEAMAVDGKFIAFVGTNTELDDYLRSRNCTVEKKDMRGRLVLPGFNDAHMHYLHYVKNRFISVDLSGETSLRGVCGRLRSALPGVNSAAGQWLIGEGWNQDKFTDEKRFLTCADLDEISKDVPVIAIRVCYHIGTLNTKAMELLGLNAKRAAELGDYVDKYENGEPNGVIKEYVLDDVKQNLPAPDVNELVNMMVKGQEALFASGITTVQSDDLKYVADGHDLELLFKLCEASQQGRLKLRMTEQCLLDTEQKRNAFFDAGFNCSFGNDRFGISCVKLLQDGSLGARTALMTEPYADDASTQGIGIYPSDELADIVARVHKLNMPVAIHAIGDKAIEQALDAIGQAQNAMPHLTPRHGIVHCQITDKALVSRFAELGVTAFVQPVFIDYDMDICAQRVGENKTSTSYAWKTLNDLGVCTAFGTDCPVEPFDVMRGIWCAVTRQKVSGSRPFNPDQAMTLDEALHCYTQAGAYAEGKENIKGKIAPGMLADFTVLDRDLYKLPVEKILESKVLETYIDGELVYERK